MLHPCIRKGKDMKEKYRLLSILLLYQKNLRNVRLLKCLIFSITLFRIKNVVFKNDIICEIAVVNDIYIAGYADVNTP